MASALARELRENVGYLRDAGWDSTATLIEASAAELDRLNARVAKLERQACGRSASRRAALIFTVPRLFGRAGKA
jgi:hypothetical protein